MPTSDMLGASSPLPYPSSSSSVFSSSRGGDGMMDNLQLNSSSSNNNNNNNVHVPASSTAGTKGGNGNASSNAGGGASHASSSLSLGGGASHASSSLSLGGGGRSRRSGSNAGHHHPGSNLSSSRGDIGDGAAAVRRSMSQHSLHGSSLSAVPQTDDVRSEIDPARRMLIWGTTVNIAATSRAFSDFIINYGLPAGPNAHARSTYLSQMEQLHLTDTTCLNVDTVHLRAFSDDSRLLYKNLCRYPQEVIAVMDMVAQQIATEYFPTDNDQPPVITIRPYNLQRAVNMRELNPSDIDQLVSVKGLVIRASNVIPDMRVGYFCCMVCNFTATREVDRGRIEEPPTCERCNAKFSMQLIHNRCVYGDKQIIRLQETPDMIPDGQTPHTLSLVAHNEVVDMFRSGDRVEVTGIYRCAPVRSNPRRRESKAVYRTFVDVVHVKVSDRRKLKFDAGSNEGLEEREETLRLSEDKEEQIRALAAEPDIYERLARSLAPSVWELDDVKKGILLMLFGGANVGNKGVGRFRGELNVLLVGDPGTSKSQLLQYVNKISARGIYTSGKGSSAVGLTAYVTRDPETKQLVLESGALVLSDGGVCCIDEFDKMSDSTRSVLHEVMEQQTISIAKAGIITTLNARTSILASANPVGSRYDPKLPITANVDLPPTLISRFDLLYLILDKPNERTDRKLAKHIIGMYTPAQNKNTGEFLDIETLATYIYYAKTHTRPLLTNEASSELVAHYVERRQKGVQGQGRTILATTRTLESYVRLSEAHARMRLSETVEVADVQEAIRLVNEALKESATDPTTGQIDMDLLTTGRSAAERQRLQDLKHEVKKMLDSVSDPNMRFANLLQELNKQSSAVIHSDQLRNVLGELEDERYLMITGPRNSNSATIRILK